MTFTPQQLALTDRLGELLVERDDLFNRAVVDQADVDAMDEAIEILRAKIRRQTPKKQTANSE
ncbi:MAG: hypothetical protein PHU85_18815 [Phycisphaerae bacterium]|nr:hypothetical protein [Phycisphaerae bacterium]